MTPMLGGIPRGDASSVLLRCAPDREQERSATGVPCPYTQPMHLRSDHVLLVFVLTTMLACDANDRTDTPAALDEPESTEPAEEVAAIPTSTFINLLPWGKIDFTRGEFPSQDDCNAFVRALPNYSRAMRADHGPGPLHRLARHRHGNPTD